MSKQTPVSSFAILAAFAITAISLGLSTHASAQSVEGQGVHFRVDGPVQRLEMIVNTSRILTLAHNAPKILVMNPEIVEAQPLSPTQIQVSARQPGVTQLNVWDDDQTLYTVDVVVSGDARELENVLKAQFPEASLRLNPLPSSIVISGYVPRPEMVSHIVQIAEDYYPKVINGMTVGGVQQILLHVKVMEVSRTKMRKLGFDWAMFNVDDFVLQNVTGLITEYAFSPGASEVTTGYGEQMAFGILDDNNTFLGFLEALRQYNLVKVLAEPTLVAVNGRPASFNSGGEFPILIPQSMGTVSVEYREFGTRVDFVAIVLGNGAIRLEVRPTVSEVDPARSVTINNTTVPGLRTRWVDTAVEMKAGQTMALGGLIQNRVESENKGLPWLSDLPWVGAIFRRVEETNNEIELLITVTPEFVEAMDAHETPPCGPGQMTTMPDDADFYGRGYLEVPKCRGEVQPGQGQPDFSNPAAWVREETTQGAAPESAPPLELRDVPPAADPTSSQLRLQDSRQSPFPARTPSQPITRTLSDAGTPAAPGASPATPHIQNNRPFPPVNQRNEATPGASPANPRIQNNQPIPPVNHRNEAAPSMIGPIGYDVLK